MTKPLALRAAILLLAPLLCLTTACNGDDNKALTTVASTSPVDAVSSVRYVSPTGQDTWPGTKSQPWRTLRHALPSMQPEQLLYVRGGDYREKLVRVHVHRGSPSRPILMMNYPHERPVIHGLVWLRQPSYWTFSGINVTADPKFSRARRPMVKITGGVGWTWKDSEIWGAQGSANLAVTGYKRGEPAKWTLSGNCIHDVNPSGLVTRSSNLVIGNMKGAGPGSITRNLIFSAPGPQNVVIGSAGGGVSDLTVEFNTLFGAGVALAVAGHTTDLRIERNIMAGVSSGIIVRWNKPLPTHNEVSQNLGNEADVFLRPFADSVVGGRGNVLTPGLDLGDVTTCHGFHSTDPGVIPYGVDGVG